jgi:hypothetical protein
VTIRRIPGISSLIAAFRAERMDTLPLGWGELYRIGNWKHKDGQKETFLPVFVFPAVFLVFSLKQQRVLTSASHEEPGFLHSSNHRFRGSDQPQ